jgi:hypothetical protein
VITDPEPVDETRDPGPESVTPDRSEGTGRAEIRMQVPDNLAYLEADIAAEPGASVLAETREPSIGVVDEVASEHISPEIAVGPSNWSVAPRQISPTYLLLIATFASLLGALIGRRLLRS